MIAKIHLSVTDKFAHYEEEVESVESFKAIMKDFVELDQSGTNENSFYIMTKRIGKEARRVLGIVDFLEGK